MNGLIYQERSGPHRCLPALLARFKGYENCVVIEYTWSTRICRVNAGSYRISDAST
ncbi:protein of unknown function [Nitrospira japonica]|uniref:Uncharacterized protein n=1 Tax=Nitrospira japonica TaxID=1325564 RepID=A0A1W1I8Y2_9BACT|nr:protein of unknown function [Nitrospira japonica]